VETDAQRTVVTLDDEGDSKRSSFPFWGQRCRIAFSANYGINPIVITQVFINHEVMKFNVGDTIRNETTQQEGRIVRLVDSSLGAGKAYIVKTVLGEPWDQGAVEVLWRESKITKIAHSQPRS
jgi:hypothetical protein